ncbi:AMP-binding protein [Gordonia humi]|uniref:AMP-binding protein n=1 Tax=Gordonia humi TaxID=686429 RepID=UPI0031EE64A6
MERGSRVCWQLPARISTVLVMFALRRLGALQAPITPICGKREVSTAVTAVDAEFVLVPGIWNNIDYVALAGDLDLGDQAAPTVVEIGPTAPEADPDPALRAPQNAEEVTWVYFNSGCTGFPKGARHTDVPLLTTDRAFAGNGRVGENGDDVVATAFPVAHVGAIEFLLTAVCSRPIGTEPAFVQGRRRPVSTGAVPPDPQRHGCDSRS